MVFPLLFACFATAATAHAADDLLVAVALVGEAVEVEVGFSVPASRTLTWAVLTDFDHMTSFISNLSASRVLSRQGNLLLVSQRGAARRGFLAFPFDVTREIRLTPMTRIESHLIQGSMKSQDGVTELSGSDEETRVVFHGRSVPDVWIPPVVGKTFIEREVREQFFELRGEILRRKGA
ncbi:MAG: hypothetical protein JNJ44_03010 [Zoogloeaceae bacterium]|nr:hypothetical protein [Zoogloeaceae bacterium]